MHGQKAELVNRANSSASERCYYKLGDPTGKSAVRCDVGSGFSIHHPMMFKGGQHDREQVQGSRMYYGLRTWHPRLQSSKGSCEYAPPA